MSLELEAYLGALQSAIRQQEAEVDAFQASVDEVSRVRQLITRLPEKVRHKAMVPYGKHAFFEGELVHTNEFLVGLGADLSLEASASQAVALLGRRNARAEAALAAARSRLAELRAKAEELQVSLSNEEGEAFMEIRQEYEESEELLAAAAVRGEGGGAAGPSRPAGAGDSGAGDRAADGAAVEAAAAAGGAGEEGDDDRIFARLAELERLEAEAGSDADADGDEAGASDREADDGDGRPAGRGKDMGDSGRSAGGASNDEPVEARATPAAVLPAAGSAAKQKAASPFKKGFLLGAPAGGQVSAKKGKPSCLNTGSTDSPAPAPAGIVSPTSPGPCSPGTGPPAAPGSGSPGVLKLSDGGNGSGSGPRAARASSSGAGGVSGTGDEGLAPRRRRVSFADGSAPGEAEDSPGPHEHRFPSPPAVSSRGAGSTGSGGLRSALKQGNSLQSGEGEQRGTECASSARGISARVVGRAAALEEEESDAAMAMARAREAAFTGLVCERVVEDGARDRPGSLGQLGALGRQGLTEDAGHAPPKRVSKFKQARMGS